VGFVTRKYRRDRCRPAAEALEPRGLLSGFSISTTNALDPGPGTANLVSNRAGSVTVYVTYNADASDPPTATADVSTSDDTARAGVDYTAVNQALTFGPGHDQQAVTIPLLNSGKNGGEESFHVNVSTPPAPGSLLPTPAQTGVVTIANRADITPPLILDFHANVVGNWIASISLTFTKPMDPTTVEDVANYRLLTGPSLQSASYDGASQTVTLTPAIPLRAGRIYTLGIRGSISLAATQPGTDSDRLRDASGNVLPTVGTDDLQFAAGKSVVAQMPVGGPGWKQAKVATNALHLAGGGTLEYLSGNPAVETFLPQDRQPLLRLIGTKAKTSLLTGSVGLALPVGTVTSPTRFHDQIANMRQIKNLNIS
jgi:hypothetical protein